MKPDFTPGKNIAMKVPSHEYEKTVHFYQTILGFKQIENAPVDEFESVAFEFGDKRLWIDKITGISQAEVWLEINTQDLKSAQRYLEQQGCVIRNEIETLPSNFNGFWLANPSNVIHLVAVAGQ